MKKFKKVLVSSAAIAAILAMAAPMAQADVQFEGTDKGIFIQAVTEGTPYIIDGTDLYIYPEGSNVKECSGASDKGFFNFGIPSGLMANDKLNYSNSGAEVPDGNYKMCGVHFPKSYPTITDTEFFPITVKDGKVTTINGVAAETTKHGNIEVTNFPVPVQGSVRVVTAGVDGDDVHGKADVVFGLFPKGTKYATLNNPDAYYAKSAINVNVGTHWSELDNLYGAVFNGVKPGEYTLSMVSVPIGVPFPSKTASVTVPESGPAVFDGVQYLVQDQPLFGGAFFFDENSVTNKDNGYQAPLYPAEDEGWSLVADNNQGGNTGDNTQGGNTGDNTQGGNNQGGNTGDNTQGGNTQGGNNQGGNTGDNQGGTNNPSDDKDQNTTPSDDKGQNVKPSDKDANQQGIDKKKVSLTKSDVENPAQNVKSANSSAEDADKLADTGSSTTPLIITAVMAMLSGVGLMIRRVMM